MQTSRLRLRPCYSARVEERPDRGGSTKRLRYVAVSANGRCVPVEDRIHKLDRLIVTDSTLGPALFQELHAAQRELGLLQGDRATCPFLRPHILPRSQYETIKCAAETLAGALEKIAIAALTD